MAEYLTEHKKMRYLFLAISAGITALTLIFPSIGFLEWISLIPAGAVLLITAKDEEIKYRKMYLYGFVYFMSFFVVNFHWFANMYPFSFIDGMTKFDAFIVVLVSWFGLSLLQTVFAAFLPVFLAMVLRRKPCKNHDLFAPFVAGALFTIFEWLQTLTWAGVPWARLPIGQTSSSVMIKSASLFGSYFITFLLVSVNFLLADFFMRKKEERQKVCVALAAGLVGLNAFLGSICMICGKDGDRTFKAAGIQVNMPSHEKWGFDSLGMSMEIVEKLSLQAADEGVELIVLPETVFPYFVLTNKTVNDFIKDLAKKCEATIVVGGFTRGEDGGLDQNSLIFVNPDGSINETVYSKRHLVPFGEYVPLRSFVEMVVPQLAEIGMLTDDLAPGKGSNIVDTELCKIGSIICFDSIYEKLTIDSVRDGAEILVMATNDSWFLDSAGVYMHNCQAKLRAVETGKYVVRAANTGISSIINSDGKVLDFEKPLVEGYVIADVSANEGGTLYTCIGNLFVYILIGFYFSLLAISLYSRKTVKEKGKN